MKQKDLKSQNFSAIMITARGCQMIFVDIKQDSTFIYSKEIELLFAVVGIFGEVKNKEIYEEVYDKDFIHDIKRKYRYLYSLHQGNPYFAIGVLELLTFCNLKDFTLKGFEDYLLKVEKEFFLYHFLGQEGDIDEIKKAVTSQSEIVDLYNKLNYIKESFPYLVFEGLFLETERIIRDIFACANELRTEQFDERMDACYELILLEEGNTREGLSELASLQYSERIMGKTFGRRGPYRHFYFMPSVFIPYKCVRYMYTDQFLIYRLKEDRLESKDVVKILKVIADESRFSILEILSKNGPMIGKEIAAKLSIATSTLSHHMDQLRSIGIIHEERVKNSKYYSVNKKMRAELIDRFSQALGKEE